MGGKGKQYMWSKSLKKNKGMTLLEVIIVLGIMGVIAAGVVVLAQRAIDSQNATKLANGLNSTQTAMVSTYRSKKSYPEVGKVDANSENLKAGLIAMGKVSEEDLINPFNGESLMIYTAMNNTKPNRGFAIKVGGLTKDQCSTIISNSSDLFAFVQVSEAGSNDLVADLFTDPNGALPLGVIKSTKGGDNTFDVTRIDHLTNLCGGNSPEAANKFYDVYVGGQ